MCVLCQTSANYNICVTAEPRNVGFYLSASVNSDFVLGMDINQQAVEITGWTGGTVVGLFCVTANKISIEKRSACLTVKYGSESTTVDMGCFQIPQAVGIVKEQQETSTNLKAWYRKQQHIQWPAFQEQGKQLSYFVLARLIYHRLIFASTKYL